MLLFGLLGECLDATPFFPRIPQVHHYRVVHFESYADEPEPCGRSYSQKLTNAVGKHSATIRVT